MNSLQVIDQLFYYLSLILEAKRLKNNLIDGAQKSISWY